MGWGWGGSKGRCFLQISYSLGSSSRTECASDTDLSSITEEFYSPRTGQQIETEGQ